MKDKAYKKIVQKIVQQSAHGERGASFQLESLFKEEGYLKKNGRTNLDTEWIKKVDAAATSVCRICGASPVIDSEANVCRGISYTKEQAMMLCKSEGLHPADDYKEAILPLLLEFKASPCREVRRYAEEREAAFPWPSLYKLTPSGAAAELTLFMRACEKTAALTDDVLIRNASKEWFGDSKTLEKNYLRKLLKVFFPEEKMAGAVEESFFLQKLHLLKNPWHQPVKGEGRIFFDDGSFVTLRGYADDAICLSLSMVDHITKIECEDLIIIENLSTFTDYPIDQKGLVLYSGGFAKTATIRFIKKTDEGTRILHFGDIDAFGFAIIENEEEKTGRKITPLCMDLATYRKSSAYLTDLSESNIRMLERMKDDERWDAGTRGLFEVMLREKKGLEQESLSL